MSELDPNDVAIGLSAETMERRALALIGRVSDQYYHYVDRKPVYGQLGVCTRTVNPLPHGCWDHGNRSPYAVYFDDRWCDACIAYAALHGTLPRPVQTIDMTMTPKLEDRHAQ